jgi:Ca2+-binding EF-hand superfamily protein
MRSMLTGGAAAAAIFVGGAALAAQPVPATQPARAARHARFMAPATRAEMQARTAAMFARLDTNHDGFVTKDELNGVEARREQKAEARAQRFDPSKLFDRLDTNHDGKITPDEMTARRARHAQTMTAGVSHPRTAAFHGLFARADTNKDDVLTRPEFDAMGQQLKARMEHASVARGGMAVRMFDQSDVNKDGRVSLAEMQQAALARFDRMDLNHDGTITPDERQQARQLFRATRKSRPAAAQ